MTARRRIDIAFPYSIFLIPLLGAVVSAQNLPITWSQSYGTYDIAAPYPSGSYGLGLGIDNFCLYNDPDSTSYDERRFDLWARFGLFRRAELEAKYSYPTAALISLKYLSLTHHRFGDASLKLGAGYMKGTREGMITDYVYDLYPSIMLSTRAFRSTVIYLAPKIIFSIHTRDIQEHTDRPAREIFQYGYGAGCAFGNAFKVMIESNWCWGNNEGVHYMVNQFGIGVVSMIR
jgi:hypothetical protein